MMPSKFFVVRVIILIMVITIIGEFISSSGSYALDIVQPRILEPIVKYPRPDKTLSSMAKAEFLWESPGTTQFQIQIFPYDNDGPGVNLVISSDKPGFTLPPPVRGVGSYVLLPGMSYTWRVRTTNKAAFAPEDDTEWGPWSGMSRFFTPVPSADSITGIYPGPKFPEACFIRSSLTPTFTWNDDDPFIFYYEIQLSLDDEFRTDPRTAIAPVYWNIVHGGQTRPLNSWKVPDSAELRENRQYYWRVRPRVQGDGIAVPWGRVFTYSTVNFACSPPPILVLKDFRLNSTTVAAGNQVALIYTISNVGYAETLGPTDVRAALSTGKIDRLAMDIGIIHSAPPLKPGDSVTQSAVVTIPDNIRPDNYFLGARTIATPDGGEGAPIRITSRSQPVSGACRKDLIYGDTVQCSLNMSSDVDRYTFEAAAGDEVIASMNVTSGTLTPELRVYYADGTLRCADSNNAPALEVRCSLSTRGGYTIFAGPLAGGAFGTYTLQLKRVNISAATVTPTNPVTATGSNLLENPGFESGQSSPDGWISNSWASRSAFVWDNTVAHSGDRSAKITISGAPDDARWIQTISVTPNTDYVLSGWIRTENVDHAPELPGWDIGANISILTSQGPLVWTRSNDLKGSNNWSFVTVSFNSGDQSNLTIAARLGHFSSTTTGTAWYDDLQLVPAQPRGLAKQTPTTAPTATAVSPPPIGPSSVMGAAGP